MTSKIKFHVQYHKFLVIIPRTFQIFSNIHCYWSPRSKIRSQSTLSCAIKKWIMHVIHKILNSKPKHCYPYYLPVVFWSINTRTKKKIGKKEGNSRPLLAWFWISILTVFKISDLEKERIIQYSLLQFTPPILI